MTYIAVGAAECIHRIYVVFFYKKQNKCFLFLRLFFPNIKNESKDAQEPNALPNYVAVPEYIYIYIYIQSPKPQNTFIRGGGGDSDSLQL